MGLTALKLFIWLLPVFTPTTQELMKLRQNPKVTAECDKHVTLNCEINSSPKGLSIKSMEWSLNKTSLCSVDMKKNITTNSAHTLSHFHCHYKHGQLTLNLSKVRPLESASSNFMCKFKSNMGTDEIYTTVELQECGTVEHVEKKDGIACTFKHVHPEGYVHWFRGSMNLTDSSHTKAKMNHWGFWTVHSALTADCSNEPCNCSLMSTQSGRYIMSTVVQNLKTHTSTLRNRVASLGPARTLWCFSVLLVVTIK